MVGSQWINDANYFLQPYLFKAVSFIQFQKNSLYKVKFMNVSSIGFVWLYTEFWWVVVWYQLKCIVTTIIMTSFSITNWRGVKISFSVTYENIMKDEKWLITFHFRFNLVKYHFYNLNGFELNPYNSIKYYYIQSFFGEHHPFAH